METFDTTHRSIRRHCEMLERLAGHLAWRGADDEARDVARLVMRFFDERVEPHHRHEEIDLFIAVEHYVPSRELNATRALLFHLRMDHRRIAAIYAELRPCLAALAENGVASLAPELVRKYSEAHIRHMELEESQLLPLARRVLPPVNRGTHQLAAD